jgi:hypothetical protein
MARLSGGDAAPGMRMTIDVRLTGEAELCLVTDPELIESGLADNNGIRRRRRGQRQGLLGAHAPS